MTEEPFSDAAARAELLDRLAELNLAVHQPTDPALFTPSPVSQMKPAHWTAEQIREGLDLIGKKIALDPGGVRRTIRLCNPGLDFGTTPTFWASVQYIRPGEVATAHRHTANALRFIMEGEGADTIVDGEKYEFNKGDLVLTPSWSFHDHEHKGEQPMIWLDVLDINLVRRMEAVFFEAFDQPRHPVNDILDGSFREFGSGIMRPVRPRHMRFENPLLVYPMARAEDAVMQAASLPPDPHFDTALEYRNPLNGEPALPTMGTMMQRLRPGVELRPQRHTGSLLNYVIRGHGQTQFNDRNVEWSTGDFVAIPPWTDYAHQNLSHHDDALMFQVNDFPALTSLKLWRAEYRD